MATYGEDVKILTGKALFTETIKSKTGTTGIAIADSGAVTLGASGSSVTHSVNGNNLIMYPSDGVSRFRNNPNGGFSLANSATVTKALGTTNATALFVVNDANGNSAIVYKAYYVNPTIISQNASRFTTSSPSTGQIQIVNNDAQGGVDFVAGATAGTTLWIISMASY